MLDAPMSREENYKAKNFIDTVVFRFGGQLGVWSHTAPAALA